MKAKRYCYSCGKDGEPFKAEGYLCSNSKCNNYLYHFCNVFNYAEAQSK